MRLLVTGATGFVGARLAIRAAREGHRVAGLGRNASAELRATFAQHEVELRLGDINDPVFVDDAISRSTHVCHLAAAWREVGLPIEHYRHVNVDGTRNVALAAARHGLSKLVFCSTIGLHPRRSKEVITEESRFDLTNPYEESKAETEDLLRAIARDTGLSIAMLRPADVYGPGDLRLLKLFRAVARQRFPLVGPGTGRRHMLHIDDLTGALLMACVQASGPCEAFIIAGPDVVTLRALLEQLTKLLAVRRFGFRVPFGPMKALAAVIEDVCGMIGVTPPIHRRSLDFFLTDVEYDTRKARSKLHWTPLVSLDSGLRQTIEWYRREQLL